MQSVLSRNWTRIAVFISCDDNHYTTGTSFFFESVEGLVSIDRSVVAALLSTTPRAWSQVVYERSLVSRSTGGSKLDGDSV